MKPTLQISPACRKQESNHRTRCRRRGLLIDYNFQAGAGGPFGRGDHGRAPDENSHSHPVSPDYYRSEMQREFFLEAIVFAVIVVVSAWPIVALIHLIVARFID